MKETSCAFNRTRRSPVAAADTVPRAALEAEDLAAWFTRLSLRAGHSQLRHYSTYERVRLVRWRAATFDKTWRRAGI